MRKAKKLDGINTSDTKVKTGKDQYQETYHEGEPLLSILEPGIKAQKNIIMPKKTHFLFRNVFEKKLKKDKNQKIDVIPSVVKESSSGRSLHSSRDDKKNDLENTLSKPKAKNKETIDEIMGTESYFTAHRKIIIPTIIVVSCIVILSGLVSGAAYAHQTIYENKFFPGVVVWGENVGGKTTNEVQKIINTKVDNYKITIKGPDQDYIAKASDLGILFNSDAMVTTAFTKGRTDNWLDDYLVRAKLFIASVDWDVAKKAVGADSLAVKPVYKVEDVQLQVYLTKVSDNIKIDPQDSQVTVVGSTTNLKPAIYGRNVEFKNLKNQVLGSIGLLKEDKINISVKKTEPNIIVPPGFDKQTIDQITTQAESVMQRPVILTYQGLDYRPSQDTVASWINFVKNLGETRYSIVLDQTKMSNYFAFLKSKIDISTITRTVRVENGVKSTETQAGKNGLLVDTALLGNQISQALPNQPNVSLSIPTYVTNFETKYENVVIADWDKYVDINLSTQTMVACERGGVNCREWRVMTGKNSTPTPVGTFLVLGRTANFWMSGLEGTPEAYRLWVPYATWFKGGGYAIHSASWRNNDPNSSNGFGNQSYTWAGSHGCVNAPDDAAVYIYNWAPVGTPVTVHN